MCVFLLTFLYTFAYMNALDIEAYDNVAMATVKRARGGHGWVKRGEERVEGGSKWEGRVKNSIYPIRWKS